MPIESKEKSLKKKLLEIAREAVKRDNALREQFEIGDKFRFIRDQLKDLLDQVEKHVQLLEAEEGKKVTASSMSTDEVVVYIYLFNTQGLVVATWQNMVIPKLFYEYSINRPIYSDKAHIEALLRSKTNKNQHAYITVIMKQADIMTREGASRPDVLGNPMIKVKEGSLTFSKMISFTHNDIEYVVNENGKLVKKESNGV